MKVITVVVCFWAFSAAVAGAENPQYAYAIGGPCGGVVEGPAGSIYDDGTDGLCCFTHPGMGYTFDVLLKISETENNNLDTVSWNFGIGADGCQIVDVSTIGTVSCRVGLGPLCKGRGGLFYELSELTGPPFGVGPQIDENHGAVSQVTLGMEGSFLQVNNTWIVLKIRVVASFPETVGEEKVIRLFFATRVGSSGRPTPPAVCYSFGFGHPITVSTGDPPLILEECAIRLRAVKPIDEFIRCEVNDDAKLDISDPIWLLNELFQGGTATKCPISRDCDGNGAVNLSDAIFALSYLFSGGPAPPAPFPACGTVQGLRQEDCPGGSTKCP